jgi:hypothetical protein
MNKRRPEFKEHEDNHYRSIQELSNVYGIEAKYLDAIISGEVGYPDIGQGMRFQRRGGIVGQIYLHPDDYNLFEKRLKEVAEKVRRKIAFVDRMKELENQMVPEFQSSLSDSIVPQDTNYLYFKPSRFGELGVFSEDDLDLFLSDRNKSMLSMGAGKGYLEKVLINMGLELNQVLVTDSDPKVLPQDLNTAIIDIHKKWSLKERKFDLIIFPESLGVSIGHKTEELTGFSLRSHNIRLFIKVMQEAAKHLTENGEIRISGSNLDEEALKAREEELKPLKIIFHNEPLLILRNTGEV